LFNPVLLEAQLTPGYFLIAASRLEFAYAFAFEF
jgi:hypothetical protein